MVVVVGSGAPVPHRRKNMVNKCLSQIVRACAFPTSRSPSAAKTRETETANVYMTSLQATSRRLLQGYLPRWPVCSRHMDAKWPTLHQVYLIGDALW